MLSNLEEHQVYAVIQVMKQNSGLARDFVPQRFHGDVLLFAATQGDSRPEPHKWKSYVEWKNLCPRNELRTRAHDAADPIGARIGRVLANAFETVTKALK